MDKVVIVRQIPHLVVVPVDGDVSFATRPRAIAPFGAFDVAQAFTQTVADRYRAGGGAAPIASVVRLESDLLGAVVGVL